MKISDTSDTSDTIQIYKLIIKILLSHFNFPISTFPY